MKDKMQKTLCKSIARVSPLFARLSNIRIARAVAGTALIGCTLGYAAHSPAAAASPETVLFTFDGTDGSLPIAKLTKVKATFYGTTYGGGVYGVGTLFSFDPKTGTETVLHSFGSGTDGSYPVTDLININGTLYGATEEGGSSSSGTVFSFNLKTGTETVLYSFAGGSDGANPFTRLINVNGTLYGTTMGGGTYGGGTVYSIVPKTGAETVLHSFGNGTDGNTPFSSLTNVDGTLYGMTYYGGTDNLGAVYSVVPKTGAETVLYSFAGASDGANPFDWAGLIDVKGTLYGTTSRGGGSNACTNACGTVFSFNPETGAEKVLHAFSYGDGAVPEAGLTKVKGKLYGTTEYGGADGNYGVVYSIVPKTGAITVLHSFASGTDGSAPAGELINVGGTLYGTTYYGGSDNLGTVYSIVP